MTKFYLSLLLAVLFSSQCNSFSVSPPNIKSVGLLRPSLAQHPLVAKRPFTTNFHQRMAEESSDDKSEADGEKSEDKSEVEESNNEEVVDESGKPTRKGVLLAVPLFCKFVIVICLKIATDLIVFPLLILYRLARLTKRKFLSLIGKGGSSDESKAEDPPGQAP